MSHINYFEPYQSKSAWHEDQLTRALLVVLRYSPAALLLFYDYVHKSVLFAAMKKQVSVSVPSIEQLDLQNIGYECQISDLTHIESNQLLSVLITDEAFDPKKEINKSERGARYDGVISFSDKLTLIIENKPRPYNVWQEQLNPNSDIPVIPVAAIVAWKEIVKRLHAIESMGSVNGAEKYIIHDFMDYIDANYGYLNPYDNLDLCKNNDELLLRREKNILLSIATNKEDVKYQPNWKAWYVETGLEPVRMIGLKHTPDDKWVDLGIAIHPGDTVAQARSYYQQKILFEKIEVLVQNKWKYISNFHISFMSTNLVWVPTLDAFASLYYTFWMSNINMIKQYSKNDLKMLIKDLEKQKILHLSEDVRDKMKDEIDDTNRQNFNVCPGISLTYLYSHEEAKRLDARDELSADIKEKIASLMKVFGLNSEFLKP